MRKKATTLLEVIVALFILAVLLLGLLPTLGQMSRWEDRISQADQVDRDLVRLLDQGEAGEGTLRSGEAYRLEVKDFAEVPGMEVVSVTLDRPDDPLELVTLRQVES
ncbi:prepilin-type N-terminal cleavage/methylation domain-containing protein [Peptococcus simiae]|uniref:Prepilin-type N-terminal cleavage/methylation domain-containing protein n=1 Tax=Peptococcus simiae TaxID=1643805 RepID=A0ABW9GZ63_9FIRM